MASGLIKFQGRLSQSFLLVKSPSASPFPSAVRTAMLLLAVLWILSVITPLEAGEPQASTQPVLRVLELINAERTRAGLSALHPDSAARTTAEVHASYLESVRMLSHRDSRGLRVLDRYRQNSGTAASAGENLGAGGSPEAIVRAWMQSPSHRENILSAGWSGIGCALRSLENGRLILVAVFSNSIWFKGTALADPSGGIILTGLVPQLVYNPADSSESAMTLILKLENRVYIPQSARPADNGLTAIRFRLPPPNTGAPRHRTAFLSLAGGTGPPLNRDILTIEIPF